MQTKAGPGLCGHASIQSSTRLAATAYASARPATLDSGPEKLTWLGIWKVRVNVLHPVIMPISCLLQSGIGAPTIAKQVHVEALLLEIKVSVSLRKNEAMGADHRKTFF